MATPEIPRHVFDGLTPAMVIVDLPCGGMTGYHVGRQRPGGATFALLDHSAGVGVQVHAEPYALGELAVQLIEWLREHEPTHPIVERIAYEAGEWRNPPEPDAERVSTFG